MSLTKRAGLLAGAAALTLTGGSLADTTPEANTTELKARIAELESRLAAVEAKDGDQRLTEQRADEIRAIVADALADADSRASSLAQGMTAGYDDGFVISSSDGNWLLRTNLLFQQRFAFGYAEAQASGTDGVWGFENTRTTFSLSGNVVSPDWFYRVDINVGNNGGGVAAGVPSTAGAATGVPADVRTGTLQAYAGYDMGNGFRIYGGEFKSPYLREEMIEDGYQLGVERSLTNYIFTAGYTNGIMVEYTTDKWRAMGSYNNGMRTNNGITFGTQSTRAALSGRFEYLVMGTWDQMEDFTSPQDAQTGLLVGGGVNLQRSQDQVVGVADTAYYGFTLDAQAEFAGANVFGAFIYEPVDNGAGVNDQDTWGFVIQGGYMFTDSWEGFARFEFFDLDTAGNDASIVSGGVTKYFDGHHAKWTTDVGFGLDTVTAGAGITDWRTDTANSDGQFVVRTQLQIMF